MSYRLNRFFILGGVIALAFLAVSQYGSLLAHGRSAGGTNAEIPCENGLAGVYPCRQVNLLSFTPKAELGAAMTDTLVANLWGWTDPENGREYVLLGLQNGTAFVDVTDPVSPTYLGLLPTRVPTAPLSVYRDMKVYRDYAFIIADTTSRNGMQIFDLTNLRGVTTPMTFTAAAHYDFDPNPADNYAHNIFIHEETGYAYAVRNALHCDGGAMIIDVQDPLNPTDAGCFSESGAASDTACVVYQGPDADYQGREICVMASDDDLVVGDVTSKTNPATLAIRSYPMAERVHHAWFTEDHRYFLTADMMDEHHHGLNTRIFIWDASDLDNIPMEPQIYTGPTTGSDHNLWIKGDYAYIGNLRAGLRILDLSHIDQGQVAEAAYFDDHPEDNDPGHLAGDWAAYIYFDSGVVAIANRQEGLYLVRPLLEQTYLPLLVQE